MKKVYHTKIEVATVCKNGSEKGGAHAKCSAWYLKKSKWKIEFEQYGKTKKDAIDKLIKFLTDNGKREMVLAVT